MKVKVFDTWVDDNKIHFDVVVEDKKENDQKKAVEFAKKFLTSIGKKDVKVTSEECSFCHVENADKEVEKAIKKDGYYIVKMKGC